MDGDTSSYLFIIHFVTYTGTLYQFHFPLSRTKSESRTVSANLASLNYSRVLRMTPLLSVNIVMSQPLQLLWRHRRSIHTSKFVGCVLRLILREEDLRWFRINEEWLTRLNIAIINPTNPVGLCGGNLFLGRFLTHTRGQYIDACTCGHGSDTDFERCVG